MGNTKISDNERSRRLNFAVDKLCPYFGLERIVTSTTAMAGESSRAIDAVRTSAVAGSSSTPTYANENPIFGDILEKFINVSVHAYDAEGLAAYIVDRHQVPNHVDQENFSYSHFNSLMNIIGTGPNIKTLSNTIPVKDESILPLKHVTLSSRDTDTDTVPMLKYLLSTIGSSPQSDTDICNISIILSNTSELSLAASNVNACSIFINGTRSIDMSRAVPYLEVNFEVPLAGTGRVDATGNAPGDASAAGNVDRLLAPSLYKFIMGAAVVTPNTTLSSLVNANRLPNEPDLSAEANSATSGTSTASPGLPYTRIGMEIFTSPQTLVNGNEQYDQNIRLNPVQDKFRPFMSLKDFSATVGANGFGAMCYSAAKLSMVLHDKSRLAEISSFIRADLFGRTHVEIEYGWTHPDGESLIRDNVNYSVDIINGMRKKERFQIIKSAFTFTENGEVNIDMDLVTLSSADVAYTLIGSVEEDRTMKILRDTQEEISRLIRITHADEQSESASSSEHHGGAQLIGIQVINSVSDGFESGFHLSKEDKKLLKDFINGNGGGPDMAALREKFKSLYEGTGTDSGSALTDVKESIQRGIKDTLKQIVEFNKACYEKNNSSTTSPTPATTTGPTSTRRSQATPQSRNDPFLTKPRNKIIRTKQINGTIRVVSDPQRPAGAPANAPIPRADRRVPPTNIATEIGGSNSASLASILTAFIGVPLARAGKKNNLWQEVQFVYHTFNNCAGFAGGTNISGFEVDLSFFYDRYQAYRISNIARSGHLTLGTFWQFLNQEIIDDIAAPSYELWDTSGSLSRIVAAETAGAAAPTRTSAAEWADEDYQHNKRITELLSNQGTPNGEWVPPQLAISIENLEVNPESSSVTGTSDRKKIIRIHIFDRTAVKSESLNAILTAARERSMSISGDGEAPVGNNDSSANNGSSGTTILNQRRAQWRKTIAQAEHNNCIEPIRNTNPVRYRVRGGFKDLKKFTMEHCAYLIPGAQGSLIRAVSLGSMQDPNASIQINSRPRPSEQLNPNGSGDRGLPLNVMPVEVSMDMFGCPLITYNSNYFIDFNTNTMIDDIWIVTGIDHKINEGSFTSNIRFRPALSYGRYPSYLNQLRDMADACNELAPISSDAALTTFQVDDQAARRADQRALETVGYATRQ
jgi:hypothetical protein